MTTPLCVQPSFGLCVPMPDLAQRVHRAVPYGVWRLDDGGWHQAQTGAAEYHRYQHRNLPGYQYLTPQQVVERLESCTCDGLGYIAAASFTSSATFPCPECSALWPLVK